MRTKLVLTLAVLCLMSSIIVVSSDSIAVADDSEDDSSITTIEAYASEFVLSDSNNIGYMAKWEISFTSDFSTIEDSSTDNTYTYTYPNDTGYFYVKEYISTSMTYDEEHTKSSVVKVLVLGPAPTITLDTMDGKTSETMKLPYIVGSGSTVSLPTPERDGYVFAGWYYDASCTQKFDSSIIIVSDTTLYASWVQSTDVGGSSDFTKTIIPIVIIVILLLAFILFLFFKRRKQDEEKKKD